MTKYILVGVDDAPESQIALRWAVDTAQQQGLAMRVVRAYLNEVEQWPAIGMAGYVPLPVEPDVFRQGLDEAVEFARDQLGYDDVSGRLVHGDAANAILTEAAGAEMVVLGSRSRSKMSAAVLGSVATAVAAKAPCPVVVVRGERRTGPIVVGADGSELSDDAVAFAFEEAARTGQALKVVHCWQAPEQHIAPIATTRQLLKNWLVENLAAYREKYPTVNVRASVLNGRPSDVLVELSTTASLMVVGSRGRGGVAGLLLGSVSQSLLHHADSPVAIVRRHEQSS